MMRFDPTFLVNLFKKGLKRKAEDDVASIFDNVTESQNMLAINFASYGKEKSLKPDEKLIAAGAKSTSIYLIIEGSLAIRRRDGALLSTLRAGMLAGELSFLTGTTPGVSAVASSPLRVAELRISDLQGLVRDAPARAGIFYACLARVLAHKVAAMNDAMKASLLHQRGAALQPASAVLPKDAATVDVAALRSHFGLPAIAPSAAPVAEALLASVECVCAVERHSVGGGEGHHAHVHLLPTHLCVQQAAFGFTHRYGIDLRDVLGVLHVKSSSTGEAGAGGEDADGEGRKKAAAGGKKGKAGKGKAAAAASASAASSAAASSASSGAASIEVQCRALSIGISGLAPSVLEALAKSIEAARLSTLDTSVLRTDGDKAAAAAEGGAADAKPPMLKRRSSSVTWVAGASSENLNVGGAPAKKGAAAAAAPSKGKKGAAKGAKGARAGGSAAPVSVGALGVAGGDDDLQKLVKHKDDTANAAMATPRWRLAGGRLSETQWLALLEAAERRRWRHGARVLTEGEESQALYTLVHGRLVVEQHVGGSTHGVVVGRLAPGDLFGEATLLLGGRVGASCTVESDEALVLRLSVATLRALFAADPSLCAKLFCQLSCEQAARLQRLTAEEAAPQLKLPKATAAPRTLEAIVANEAYLTIFQKWAIAANSASEGGETDADALPPKTKKPKKGGGASSSSPSSAVRPGEVVDMVQFLITCRALRNEAEPTSLLAAAIHAHETYTAGARATRPLACVPANVSDALSKVLLGGSGGGVAPNKAKGNGKAKASAVVAVTAPSSVAPAQLRRAFEDAVAAVTAELEASCLVAFLGSSHYSYVLNLRLKEGATPSMEQFRANKVLGEGGFGQVLEVVKRDCGVRYAMKVQKKAELKIGLAEIPGGWEAVVLLERDIQVKLHHPLLVNLAYAFQTPCHLVLVMDACPGGDLAQFVLREADDHQPLSAEQVRFIGLEVVAALAFLHDSFVLYRDLKPENLLLDADGHVRMIDFGLALLGDGALPLSTEIAGTGFYMAPEVSFAGDPKRTFDGSTKGPPKPYAGGADWWTLGVLLYELTESELPFGDDPQFSDFEDEWRPMENLPEEASAPPPAANGKAKAGTGGKKAKKGGGGSSGGSPLLDLIHALLTWDANERLGVNGSAEVKAHPFWGHDVEWDLVGGRRLPSPLAPLMLAKTQPKSASSSATAAEDDEAAQQKKEKAQRRKAEAVETATALARAEAIDEHAAEKASQPKKAVRWLPSLSSGGGEGASGSGSGSSAASVKWSRTRTGRTTASVGRNKARADAAAAAAAEATGTKRLAPLRSAGDVPGWEFTSPHAVAQEYLDSQAVSLV